MIVGGFTDGGAVGLAGQGTPFAMTAHAPFASKVTWSVVIPESADPSETEKYAGQLYGVGGFMTSSKEPVYTFLAVGQIVGGQVVSYTITTSATEETPYATASAAGTSLNLFGSDFHHVQFVPEVLTTNATSIPPVFVSTGSPLSPVYTYQEPTQQATANTVAYTSTGQPRSGVLASTDLANWTTASTFFVVDITAPRAVSSYQVSVYPQTVPAAGLSSLNLGHRRRALEDGARQYEPEAAAASTHTSASAGTMATAPRKMSRGKW